MRAMLRRFVLAGLLAAGAALPAAAHPNHQPVVRDAWIRTPPPGAPTAAAYVVIYNPGRTADRLVSARTPAARRTEIHEMSMDGGVMRMRAVQGGLPLAAGSRTALQPGGLHLMLMDLQRPLRTGDRVPLILRFERGGFQRVAAVVRPAER